MQQQSSSSSSNRFIEHDVCWKTKNSVVECKASENVCENLLDVLGESETYFLPSGWKLENHQLKFSSRLPLQNIHHIPVRGPRATEFQFFYHRVTTYARNVGKYQNGTSYTRVRARHQWTRLVLFSTPWLNATGEDRRVEERFVPLWTFAIPRCKTRKFRRRALF